MFPRKIGRDRVRQGMVALTLVFRWLTHTPRSEPVKALQRRFSVSPPLFL